MLNTSLLNGQVPIDWLIFVDHAILKRILRYTMMKKGEYSIRLSKDIQYTGNSLKFSGILYVKLWELRYLLSSFSIIIMH